MTTSAAVRHELGQLRVACIMDEFTYKSYGPDCNLRQLTPHGWLAELSDFQPDFLFVESAWRGHSNLWDRRIQRLDDDLVGILDWCRRNDVPTIFWNKEDPIHFNTFLNTAASFDYVFTTDLDRIHRYKAVLGHDRVFLLPFACQPQLFNPMEIGERIDAFCFAGAYYVRYPERARDLRSMVSELTKLRPFLIYDRNHGADDPNYSFPREFRPLILGHLPFDRVDRAYKGYRYAVNLNSVKQSQTMCARRVFELLGSNSVVVSNYAHAVRLMFGDLVIASDSAEETAARVSALLDDERAMHLFRLAGLRKTLQSHTYRHRLAYIWSKVTATKVILEPPDVLVISHVRDRSDAERVLASYKAQTYMNRRLIMVAPASSLAAIRELDTTVVVRSEEDRDAVGDREGAADFVAGMVPDDHYGANYLLDLALATRFSSAPVIGKATYYESRGSRREPSLVDPGRQYTSRRRISARRAMVRSNVLDKTIQEFALGLRESEIELDQGIAIDEFNYCAGGTRHERPLEWVDDLGDLDEGINIDDLLTAAEGVEPIATTDNDAPSIDADTLEAWLEGSRVPGLVFRGDGAALEIESTLPDGQHAYAYAGADIPADTFGFPDQGRFFLDVSPGLDVRFAMRFLDDEKNRLGSTVFGANANEVVAAPEGTTWVRPGLRILGSGVGRVNGLVLGHRVVEPPRVVGRGHHLVVTSQYPSYDNLYRNAFVHQRVKVYRGHGLRADVFRLRPKATLSYHEFDGVECITGSQAALDRLLAGGRYKTVMVHFLSEAMWEVLERYIDQIRVIVWIHGSEVQPWHRRLFNFETEDELDAEKQQSDLRMAFWQRLLRNVPENLKLVFVSEYFAEEVMEDVGVKLPSNTYEIIHNPIDTDLFQYHPKPAEQRKRILSIRSYASRKYANDLSVKAILALSNRDWFGELEFRMIGDGPLFDEVLAPLHQMPNVTIERRFLKQTEIASLQGQYGVFLNPTRWDSHGVSRDEAMSSGLVPITNGVAAVPEFVDETCGVVVPDEDYEGLAEAIAGLVENIGWFEQLSAAAASRVRAQASSDKVIPAEVALIRGVG